MGSGDGATEDKYAGWIPPPIAGLLADQDTAFDARGRCGEALDIVYEHHPGMGEYFEEFETIMEKHRRAC